MKELKIFYAIALIIAAVAFFIYRSDVRNDQTEKDISESKNAADYAKDIVTSGPLDSDSKYIGNSLKNGTSPFDSLYGKGIYSKNHINKISISNESNYDVVAFLVSFGDDKVLRNEYIKSNSSFQMTKVSDGMYYLKYYYGHDWNPKRKTKGVTTGGFINNEQFYISKASGLISLMNKMEHGIQHFQEVEIILETTKTEGQTMYKKSVKPEAFFSDQSVSK